MRTAQLTFLALGLLADIALAAGPESQPTTQAALPWLEKAEAAAYEIEDAEVRNTALSFLAVEWMERGQVDRAKAIAERLPGHQRDAVLIIIPATLAHAGNFDAALAEAENLDTSTAMVLVISIMAKTDAARALKLVQTLPDARQPELYRRIVTKQVLDGDLDGARNTAQLITEDQEKHKANLWLQAGLIAASEEPAKAATEAKAAMESLSGHLSDIAESRAAADPEKATRLLGVIDSASGRADVHIAIAEHYLGAAQQAQAIASIERAIAEVAAIPDGDMAGFKRTVCYMHVADLQIRVRRLDDAINSMRLAEESIQAVPSLRGFNLVEDMGGNLAIIEGLAKAGRLEQARAKATQEDGAIMPGAIPLLVEAYASKGDVETVADLLKSATDAASRFNLYMAAAKGALAGIDLP